MDENTLYKMADHYFKSIKKYSSQSAAGMLFICTEDKTIFLIKRSPSESKPLTWGTPGGKIEDGENPIQAATREITEELGSMPDNKTLLKSNVFKNGNFSYTTFIYDLPLKEKQKWNSSIELNKENINYQWFRLNQLPKKLHPGMKDLIPIAIRLLT